MPVRYVETSGLGLTVTGVKLSVCIPYKARLDNLAIALEALARQTMSAADFEVIIGAMEYSTELIALCAGFRDRLNLVTVCSSREFHIPRARNLAMRNATGEVVVQIDADTMLAPEALQRLCDYCFAFGQRGCAVGQVVGYDNNAGGDIDSVELRPYEEHLAALRDMASAPDWPADPRFRVEHNIPWAFAWTGLIALPAAAVASDRLYFDESFRGWGNDDLEWGYRVCASGIPDRAAARRLRPPPSAPAQRGREHADRDGERRPLPAQVAATRRRTGLPGRRHARERPVALLPGVARPRQWRGRVRRGRGHRRRRHRAADRRAGGRRRQSGRPRVSGVLRCARRTSKILPLTGIALPFAAGEVASCRVGPRIQRLPAGYRDAVLAEAERVSGSVIVDA